jgi:predicted anti-sigma-YlaC factor YlaD
MNCEKHRKMMSDALDGSLDRQEKKKLELHLRSCADCRLYFEELQLINEKIKTLPEVEMESRAEFENKLSDKLRRLEREYNHEKRRNERWLLRPTWALIPAALAIVLVVYFVFSFRPASSQNLQLATLMSYEDSYLILTQNISEGDYLEKFNEEVLDSIFKELRNSDVESGEDEVDVYLRQNNIEINDNILLKESMKFTEGI